VTTEIPWPTGGFDQEPTDAETDPFQSLGFGFTEESPTMDPRIVSDSEPIVGTTLVPLLAPTSMGLVPTSRRALREAERIGSTAERAAPTSGPAAGRPRRDDAGAPRPIFGKTARRGAIVSVPANTVAVPANTPAVAPSAAAATAPTVSRSSSSRVPISRRITQKTFPPVVMVAVAALLVGTSVPANALFDPDAPPASLALSSMPANTTAAADAPKLEDQVIEADAAGELAATAASRDEWGVTSYAEMLRLRYGSTNYAYSTSGIGAIRWPFAFAAPIVSAFGDRIAPCRGCSSYHRGIDFDAGYGAPVGAIADGVVLAVGRSSAYGYRVEIEHLINGQRFTSLYAHMIDNSSVLQVGSPVVAGEIVGAVGSTGLSTGPHLHLEIRIDDVPVDPFAWLMANAT